MKHLYPFGGTLRFLPPALLLLACKVDPLPSVEVTRELRGCIISEQFHKGGAAGIGARISEVNEIIVKIPGLGEKTFRTNADDGRQAIADRDRFDPGDEVDIKLSAKVVVGTEVRKDESIARRVAEARLETRLKQDKISVIGGEVSVVNKGGCKESL